MSSGVSIESGATVIQYYRPVRWLGGAVGWDCGKWVRRLRFLGRLVRCLEDRTDIKISLLALVQVAGRESESRMKMAATMNVRYTKMVKWNTLGLVNTGYFSSKRPVSNVAFHSFLCIAHNVQLSEVELLWLSYTSKLDNHSTPIRSSIHPAM
jgi:hypothetical protein